MAESTQFVLDYAEAIKDAALNLADAQLEMGELAGTFEQMGKREDALQRIFDLGNAPLDAEGRIRDIELAIDDLSVAAEGIDLSEGLDPSNVKADALLDAIDGLRPQIQERIVSAFATGGPEAATKLATDYAPADLSRAGRGAYARPGAPSYSASPTSRRSSKSRSTRSHWRTPRPSSTSSPGWVVRPR